MLQLKSGVEKNRNGGSTTDKYFNTKCVNVRYIVLQIEKRTASYDGLNLYEKVS